jgi:hypothetical protein
MTTKALLFAVLLAVNFVPFTSGDESDENFYYANSNNKFLFNSRRNCAPSNVFDIDYFKCRLCDPNFNLIASDESEFRAGLWSLFFQLLDYRALITSIPSRDT